MNTAAHSLQPAAGVRRLRIEVRGLVQGVGFRPQVLRLADDLGLAGWVRNHGGGVTIEIEGSDVEHFADRLRANLPPLARIDSLSAVGVAVTGERGFRIAPSAAGEVATAVPADVAICDACLRELFDPADRRYGHPFIACCNCGPRFSMTRRLPYDRRNTSMADFGLCDACAQEYRDPASRRLHAEPIACHDCGPRLSHPIVDIVATLAGGGIVALKGIGGYHLLCAARDADAVRRLRARKHRPEKPLAVMALNVASTRRVAQVDDGAAALLESRQRPIVILPQRADAGLPAALSPGVATLGVLLPYTPLHYLLFHALLDRPAGREWLDEAQDPLLVCTSANRSDEPMVSGDDEARTALGGIADLVVAHDRDISNACDDSVAVAAGARPVLLRRGRGHAPTAIALGTPLPSVLGLGAHLKSTVCAVRGDHAVFSSHIGDLGGPGTRALHARSARTLLEQLGLAPAALACDLHPDFASSRLGEELAAELCVPLLPVQHHHAHIAATLAACGHAGPALGLALDGHGLGTDGSSWGGELLLVDGARCQRRAHLSPLSLPGGDRAAREPWRLAAAWLQAQGRAVDARDRFGDEALLEPVLALAATSDSGSSTAAGRHFDLAAALLGVATHNRYEAQAAMRLETLCARPVTASQLFSLATGELSLAPLFAALADERDAQRGAALFHGVLIDALAALVQRAGEETGLRTVALSGGCFANRWLATLLPERLAAHGFTVLTGWERVPPGDGGISLGQAWVAAHWLRHEGRTDNKGVSVCA